MPREAVPAQGADRSEHSGERPTGRFRKIDPRIWNDEKFRGLSDFAKLAFVFLLSHPAMTCVGAMRATAAGLAAELSWTVQRFTQALAQLTSRGMVEVDASACFIALPNFLKYNRPNGPNAVRKAWGAALELVPECDGKRRVQSRCQAFLAAQSAEFRRAIGDAILDALGDGIEDGVETASSIQEQEQEQEKELESERDREQKPHPPALLSAKRRRRTDETTETTEVVGRLALGLVPLPDWDSAGFQRWLATYPRREAIPDAVEAWDTIRPDATLQATIAAGVARLRASPDWVRDGGRFIPQPGRFLREQRWLDERDVPLVTDRQARTAQAVAEAKLMLGSNRS